MHVLAQAVQEPWKIELDALVTQLIISFFIPLLVGIITKISAPAGVKAIAMIILNAVSSAVVTATQQDGTAVISQTTLLFLLLGIMQSVAVYYGVWRPTQVAPAIQNSTRGFGIGPRKAA